MLKFSNTSIAFFVSFQTCHSLLSLCICNAVIEVLFVLLCLKLDPVLNVLSIPAKVLLEQKISKGHKFHCSEVWPPWVEIKHKNFFFTPLLVNSIIYPVQNCFCSMFQVCWVMKFGTIWKFFCLQGWSFQVMTWENGISMYVTCHVHYWCTVVNDDH